MQLLLSVKWQKSCNPFSASAPPQSPGSNERPLTKKQCANFKTPFLMILETLLKYSEYQLGSTRS
ncbi:unnamed protein product [Rhodiola kirilowii]